MKQWVGPLSAFKHEGSERDNYKEDGECQPSQMRQGWSRSISGEGDEEIKNRWQEYGPAHYKQTGHV